MILANDLCAPEGPLPLAGASLIPVERAAECSCVTHLNVDGKTRSCICKTDRPIGLAMSADGAMWADAPKTPSLCGQPWTTSAKPLQRNAYFPPIWRLHYRESAGFE